MKYRFQGFTVDTGAHELLKSGLRISIQEQPFQVLLALLACPGQVVTRAALRTRLWGTDTFVNFDQSLNSAVRRLRLALNDDSRKPQYLETVPRVGFRFVSAVTADAPVPVAPASSTARLPSPRDTPLPVVVASALSGSAGRRPFGQDLHRRPVTLMPRR